MDNVLGLGLLGVICCLYHQLWRAETERERENERNWQRAADRESRTSPHYSQILLGVDQTGAIWSLKFKEFHCLFLALSLCTSITRKGTETHIHLQSTRTLAALSPAYGNSLSSQTSGATSCQVGLLPPCHFVTPGFKYMGCRGSWVGGGRKTRQQSTHGAWFWSLGHHTVCLWRFWWFIC